MSRSAIRAALEVALNSMSPSIITAWENAAFIPPTTSIPYQKSFMLFGAPENLEMGGGYNEIGYMQVTLQYPLQAGPGVAEARAMAIRAAFPKKSSFTHSGVVTIVEKTPAIGNGVVDVDRWAVTVKIPFKAQIY